MRTENALGMHPMNFRSQKFQLWSVGFSFLHLLLITGCSPTILSILDLSYSKSTGVIHGQLIISPSTLSRFVTSCEIEPNSLNSALFPPTLSIHPITCVITGTPTASLTSTQFTIMATDGSGNTGTAILTLAISPCDALATPYGYGTGTSSSPYLICSGSQLQNITNNLNADYTLATHLDLTHVSFTPIASNSSPFTGNLNGNNFGIANLTLNLPTTDYVGLFASISGSTSIANLTLNNFQIIGQNYVGALAGNIANATVTNCALSGSISGEGNNVGGFLGYASGGAFSFLSSSAQINGVGNGVGGLIGVAFPVSTVTHSYATGSVTSNGHCTGGLIGDSGQLTVNQSYSTGAVVSYGFDAGGLVGCLDNVSLVFNSYSTSSVNMPTGAGGVGGLIGAEYNLQSHTSITNSFSSGPVNGPNDVGGLVGLCTPLACGTSVSSYWDINTSNQTSSVGLGDQPESTSAMQTQSTFAGWDFVNIWYPPVAGKSYPTLR